MVQGETPDIFKVIIADSSFATLGGMLRRNPSLAGLNPAFLQTVMWELGRALGQSPDDISPEASAPRLGSCALLVIRMTMTHSHRNPMAGKSIVARADPTLRGIYLALSGGHGDAIYLDPQTYQKTVLDFLTDNLPGAAPD